MRAIVLSIGDELLCGDCVDTNSSWLCARFAERGVQVCEVLQIPDDRERIADAFRSASGRCEVIVSTGGLGPTPDDLTSAGLADAVGDELVRDETAVGWIRDRLVSRGHGMIDSQATMGDRPTSAVLLRNANGTAPIVHRADEGCRVWCLPGPPVEMRPAFEQYIAPELPPGRSLASQEVRCCGIIEADAAALLGELIDRDRTLPVGTRVSRGSFIATVHEEGPESDALLADVATRLAPWAFGGNDEGPQHDVARMLLAANQTLATAESCTGGWIGASIVDVPGSSRWYRGGVVSYSNELKHRWLDVPMTRFGAEGPGAVSGEVARDMAAGIRATTGSDWGVSVTGVAGPDGGTERKPVGTVWIGISSGTADVARQFRFPGDRTAVRRRAVAYAMQCLRFAMLETSAPLALEVGS